MIGDRAVGTAVPPIMERINYMYCIVLSTPSPLVPLCACDAALNFRLLFRQTGHASFVVSSISGLAFSFCIYWPVLYLSLIHI